MTENLRVVSIGEVVVSDAPDEVLVAYGLGSCVAVCLYDPVARVGGMLHALLPTTLRGSEVGSTPAKFVDRGVPLLVDSLLDLGAKRTRMSAKLCGGAQLLSAYGAVRPGRNGQFNTGKLNVLAAEVALHSAGIWIRARSTGGHIGRTVKLHLSNGRVTVKTLEHGERTLG